MSSDSTLQSLISQVLQDLDLAGLRVVATATDVHRMEQSPGCAVTFPESLRRALQAFLTSRRGSSESANDAPCGLIFDVPDAHGLPANPNGEQVAEVLRSYLKKDDHAEVVLLTQTTVQQEKYRFAPEYGESLETNWVYRILLPSTFDVLAWAIVNKTGQQPAYAYCMD